MMMKKQAQGDGGAFPESGVQAGSPATRPGPSHCPTHVVALERVAFVTISAAGSGEKGQPTALGLPRKHTQLRAVGWKDTGVPEEDLHARAEQSPLHRQQEVGETVRSLMWTSGLQGGGVLAREPPLLREHLQRARPWAKHPVSAGQTLTTPHRHHCSHFTIRKLRLSELA